jgi:hypothetical protein
MSTLRNVALMPVDAERWKFNGAVAGGHAEHEPPARQLIDRCGRLGGMQRVTQGKNEGARRKRDRRGVRCHQAQPHPRIVDLAQISKIRVPQRHVSRPETGKSELLGAPREMRLVAHAGLVPFERLDRKEHAER